ncbi:MAG TPA: dihydrofolate reductase family protein [Candidatus Saccharimonadales bacterium]|nr:dihydrofolate reductase family protein [Candidatus Saccharimonadales bacterium]
MKTFIIAALTADGFIGRSAGHTADWTGSEDKKVFVRLTKEAGVMVLGARTFATIGRALPGRRNIVYTRHPESITSEGVETTLEPPSELLTRLEKEGVTAVAICGGTSIYDLFMQANLVDELYLTVSPLLFGTGVRLFDVPVDVHLELKESSPVGTDSVLLHYVVVKG